MWSFSEGLVSPAYNFKQLNLLSSIISSHCHKPAFNSDNFTSFKCLLSFEPLITLFFFLDESFPVL